VYEESPRRQQNGARDEWRGEAWGENGNKMHGWKSDATVVWWGKEVAPKLVARHE